MKMTINIDGVDYEYNVSDKSLSKNEWLKCVNGEWYVHKFTKDDINEYNVEWEEYDE